MRTRLDAIQTEDAVRSAVLAASFDNGAAASIYAFNAPLPANAVAKIYNEQFRRDTSLKSVEKLLALIVRHDELVAKLPFVLWPDELIFDRADVTANTMRQSLLGFTMQRLPAGTISLYTLMKQHKYRSHFQTGAATRVAARVADYLARLHAAGIVFCDLNPKNIHVSKDLDDVYFLDADGYQAALGGAAIPSRGVTEGYASPAAIANHSTHPTALRSASDDNFVLAILMFQLLHDRAHPFATGPHYAEHPAASHNDNISARRFAFGDVARYHPDADAANHYARLVTPLKAAFRQSFLGTQPLTAAEWAKLLSTHMAAPFAASATSEPNPAALNPPAVASAPIAHTRRVASRPLRSPSVPSATPNLSVRTAPPRSILLSFIAVPLAIAVVGSLRSHQIPAPDPAAIVRTTETRPELPPERTRIINTTLSPAVERMLAELPATLDSINASVRRKRARRS